MVCPRELEQDIGRQSAAVPGSSFTGPVCQEPRAAGPGANVSGNNSERSLCHRQRSRWRSIRVAAQILSDQGPRPGEKIQKGGAGRQAAGAPILLRVHLPTAEASEKGASAQISKGSHEPTVQNHLGNGNDSWLTFFGDKLNYPELP